MFMKRLLRPSDGVVAGQAYWLDYTVVLASGASDCAGIGGSPGFSVVVKVRGAPAEPRTLLEAVRKIPDWEWMTQVVVRLPVELANAGDVSISVSLRGVPSVKALVRID